jgi:hypothetical protein
MTRRFLAVVVLCVLSVSLARSTASAQVGEPAPKFQVDLIAIPTHLLRGSFAETGDEYEVVVVNLGGRKPEGTTTMSLSFDASVTVESFRFQNGWECEGAGTSEATCRVSEFRQAGGEVTLRVGVAGNAPSSVTATASLENAAASSVAQDSLASPVGGSAAFGISRFDAGLLDNAGDPDTLAGAHPYSFGTTLATPLSPSIFNPGFAEFQRTSSGHSKDVVFDLPVGLVGNPLATGRCPVSVFLAQGAGQQSECPQGSQIGEISVSAVGAVNQGVQGSEEASLFGRNPIFNLVPEYGYPAELGIQDTQLSHGVVAVAALVHTQEGYVVRVVVPELNPGVEGPYYLQTSIFGSPQQLAGIPYAKGAFLTNSSDCSGRAQVTSLHLDSWDNPASVPRAAGGAAEIGALDFSQPQWAAATGESPAVTGCEGLRFEPSIAIGPTQSSSDSATGLDVNIDVPQNEDPEGRATPPLRNATVTLPRGLVVDPSSADGLGGCSPAQIAVDSTEPGQCPNASQLGSATVSTPLIDHELPGTVYLATPECSPCSDADGAAGRLLKLYIEISDPVTGVVVKLPGAVQTDPATGQLTASFKENPQLPFESLEVHLRAGARAPLTTPLTCGEYRTGSALMPWSAPQSGPVATRQSHFDIDSGPNGSACPASEGALSNSPSFEAGTVAPLASTYSPFVLKVSRENGSQRIASIDTSLPAGLTGKLAGIPYCSDAAIAAASGKGGRDEQSNPSCPAASEVGTVTVGAGSGNPFYVQGHAYLAGPYKGAPVSLEIITPAVAGPFDLGTVAVRTALYVNEYSTQIHAVSDQIPSILAGIPLDVRSIAINLNRPQFTLNPTSCNAMQILGSTTSTLGQTASLQNRFQVGGCRGLEFKPKLALSLKGPTKRTGHPALKAVVTYPKGGGYANIARAQVSLPHSEFLDQNNIAQACTKALLTARACPTRSIYGKAKAWSPLLDQPLQGPVYLVGGYGYKLPALVAELNGQIKVLLVGKVDSGSNKGIRNTFEAVPDAPVEKFVLEMKGGKKYGLLINSENICKKQQMAGAAFRAQNGAVDQLSVKVANSCKSGSKSKKAKRSGK